MNRCPPTGDKPPMVVGIFGPLLCVSCTDCSNGMSMALNSLAPKSTRLTWLRLAGAVVAPWAHQNDFRSRGWTMPDDNGGTFRTGIQTTRRRTLNMQQFAAIFRHAPTATGKSSRDQPRCTPISAGEVFAQWLTRIFRQSESPTSALRANRQRHALFSIWSPRGGAPRCRAYRVPVFKKSSFCLFFR